MQAHLHLPNFPCIIISDYNQIIVLCHLVCFCFADCILITPRSLFAVPLPFGHFWKYFAHNPLAEGSMGEARFDKSGSGSTSGCLES